MALKRKANQQQVINLLGYIPIVPEVPKDLIEKFPSFGTWDEELQSWWTRFQELAQRDRDSISQKFTDQQALITTLQADVAALKTQIAALTP